MFVRCENCPVPNSRQCAASSHSRLCELRRKDRSWDRRILDRSGIGSPTLYPDPTPHDGRLRVGIYSVGCFLGGAERWIIELLRHCDSTKIRWEGVAYLQAISMAPEVPTVRNEWLSFVPVAEGAEAIRQLAERCDLLIGWGLNSQELARSIPETYPIIQVSHSALDEPGVHNMSNFPISTLAAVSRAALRGIPPDRRDSTKIIWNGVNADRVRITETREETLRRWGLPPTVRVAGALGRLANTKRLDLLIRSVEFLPKPWVAVCVGAGTDAESFESLARSVDPKRIIFPGPELGPVGNALQAFDVHVMTTKTEACSYGAMETWKAGCPLISTLTGQLEDLPNLARLLPNPPSPREIAEAILADHADAEGTRDRVKAARDFCDQFLSSDQFGRRWTDFLLETGRKATEPVVKVVSLPSRPQSSIDPIVRDKILACNYRGDVLPISEQLACGCGGDLSLCRAGKGKISGKVTLRDCIECKS